VLPVTPPGWDDLNRPPLREDALRRAVVTGGGSWTALDVVVATGSTNADLAARARSGDAAAGTVLTTDDQRAGRGRRERSWVAPARSAVAVSVLLAPQVPQARWSWIPLLAGVAVRDALVAVAGVDARLKWPNDVLVGERKLGGLLAEVVDTPSGPMVVVGVGINVSQRVDELAVPTATSLALAGAATTDRDTLLRALLRSLGARYLDWVAAGGDPRASGVGAAYREACSTLGAAVRVHLPHGARGEELLEGVAEGVDDDGRLLVAGPTGVRALAAGDVVHVRGAARTPPPERDGGAGGTA
jgi:BirA family biotin operon repressor/biotin-[acetyl-CoA-carboxylase] ligase